MNSWAMLLLLDMRQGKYLHLSPRLPTQYDWLMLCGLIYDRELYPVEVKT